VLNYLVDLLLYLLAIMPTLTGESEADVNRWQYVSCPEDAVLVIDPHLATRTCIARDNIDWPLG